MLATGFEMRITWLTVVAVATAVLASTAHAAFPGANGRIAFQRDFESECFNERIYLHTINPDGSGLGGPPIDFSIEKQEQPSWSPDGARLVYWQDGKIVTGKPDGSEPQSFGFDSEQPAWSPDGTRLVFAGATTVGPFHVFTSDPDGANATQLTSGTGETQPSWSPDGSKIAYTVTGSGDAEIYTMNADGAGQTPITSNTVDDEFPNWSPNGARIVFARGSRIWTMDPDGGNAVQLTSSVDTTPAWSPDGSRIAFVRGNSIWTMNAAGGGETQVTSNECDANPDWQPVPAAGYPRPKGATPMYVSLVPAYALCAAPNRTHGAPLSFGSCAPPGQTSSQLTVGTPDANHSPAKSVGFATITTKLGNPSTPADEADVRLIVSVTDVRRAGDLTDYPGTLEARPLLRVTDRDNTPYPGGPGPGTVTDLAFPFSVPCNVTADATVGSTCSVLTSADAVLPDAVKEGKRTLWQIEGYEVRDGDGAPFLREGLFIP